MDEEERPQNYSEAEYGANKFMPSQIKILEQKEAGNGWKMKVRAEDLAFEVTLDKAYWQMLTGGKQEPAELVKRSFEFLLERESKGSILSEFELPIIQKYFPEYENEMRKMIP